MESKSISDRLLGRAFKESLARVKGKMSPPEVVAIEEILDRLIEKPSALLLEEARSRFEALEALPKATKPPEYEHPEYLIPEISGVGAAELIRDPLYGDTVLTGRCTALLELPEFHRLLFLRTTPAWELAYPSMSTTQFESLLGGYSCTTRYLRRLIQFPEFRRIVQPLHLRTAVLLSLIERVGQYPFSGQIQRAVRWASGRSMIRGEEYDPRYRGARFIAQAPAREAISKAWGVNVDTVATLVSEPYTRDDASREWGIILSVTDGPIDASSLDSVARTLWKAGIPLGFDVEHFINSLRPDPRGQVIGMSIDDLPSLEGFLLARYRLVEQVANHPTALAADSMLVHGFSDLMMAGCDLADHLDMNDWEFLAACMGERAHNRATARGVMLLRSFQEGRLHRVVATWSLEAIRKIMGGTMESAMRHDAGLEVRISDEIEHLLSRALGKPLLPGSIILRIDPDIIFWRLFEVPVILLDRVVDSSEVSPVIASLLQKVAEHSLPIRLLASEDAARHLATLDMRQITELVATALD